MNIYNNILLIIVLIGFNAFFVAIEYALLTLRKTKVDQYVRQKVFGYSVVRKALDNLYTIISVTQLGSTICSILLGWFGEPMIEKVLFPLLKMIPVSTTMVIDKTVSIVLTIIILSFFQILFGEIIPKTIALQKADIISRALILPLNFFTILFFPFVIITNSLANLFLKLIHMRPFSKKPIDYTQEEIRIILDESMKNRIIPYHQARLLSNIFSLQRTSIVKLLVDKNKLVCFHHNETLGDIKKKVAENKQAYNRYPIYFSKNLIVGFIHLSDVLRFPEGEKNHIKLSDTHLIREILYVNETHPADKLLILMREKGVHAAVVMSQSQELLGIVTLTDIIEFLVHHR
ncbi:HlyC/CorC family transporter [Candidatus Roizmanbacteria bacterium]|nr:HlyC/CorC family transporter [Candidatus Roizmanbacteria bacterium]